MSTKSSLKSRHQTSAHPGAASLTSKQLSNDALRRKMTWCSTPACVHGASYLATPKKCRPVCSFCAMLFKPDDLQSTQNTGPSVVKTLPELEST